MNCNSSSAIMHIIKESLHKLSFEPGVGVWKKKEIYKYTSEREALRAYTHAWWYTWATLAAFNFSPWAFNPEENVLIKECLRYHSDGLYCLCEKTNYRDFFPGISSFACYVLANCCRDHDFNWSKHMQVAVRFEDGTLNFAVSVPGLIFVG